MPFVSLTLDIFHVHSKHISWLSRLCLMFKSAQLRRIPGLVKGDGEGHCKYIEATFSNYIVINPDIWRETEQNARRVTIPPCIPISLQNRPQSGSQPGGDDIAQSLLRRAPTHRIYNQTLPPRVSFSSVILLGLPQLAL